MHKFLLCAAAITSLSSAASAADIPVKAPRLPPPVVSMWDGFYGGVHVGYLWGSTRVVEDGVLTDPHAPTEGGVGGVLAGVNRQNGAYVFGLEGDFGWAHARGTGGGTVTPIDLANQYTINWTSYLRARAGYLIDPTTLLFIAGGLALTDFRFQEGDVRGNLGTVFAGWTIGGGIDHILSASVTNTNQLIGRIEYLYADYGHKIYRTASDEIYDVGLTSHTLRGALILRFGSN